MEEAAPRRPQGPQRNTTAAGSPDCGSRSAASGGHRPLLPSPPGRGLLPSGRYADSPQTQNKLSGPGQRPAHPPAKAPGAFTGSPGAQLTPGSPRTGWRGCTPAAAPGQPRGEGIAKEPGRASRAAGLPPTPRPPPRTGRQRERPAPHPCRRRFPRATPAKLVTSSVGAAPRGSTPTPGAARPPRRGPGKRPEAAGARRGAARGPT